MTELTDKDKLLIMIDRYKNLLPREKLLLKYIGGSVNSKLTERIEYAKRKEVVIDEAHLRLGSEFWDVERYWKWSMLGIKFDLLNSASRYGDLDKVIKAVSMVKSRKKWGSIKGHETFLEAIEANEATPLFVEFFLSKFSVEDKNVFDAHFREPLFNVGQIVQLRKTAGADSVLTRHEYGHTSTTGYWYGCSRWELELAKNKTFMVIGIDPKVEGNVYAKPYKYKEKQGGCRYYKLLPMGEQKTYFVVEKFMKKCRTRAVKDARKQP
jgi:hypothetical protein